MMREALVLFRLIKEYNTTSLFAHPTFSGSTLVYVAASEVDDSSAAPSIDVATISWISMAPGVNDSDATATATATSAAAAAQPESVNYKISWSSILNEYNVVKPKSKADGEGETAMNK